MAFSVLSSKLKKRKLCHHVPSVSFLSLSKIRDSNSQYILGMAANISPLFQKELHMWIAQRQKLWRILPENHTQHFVRRKVNRNPTLSGWRVECFHLGGRHNWIHSPSLAEFNSRVVFIFYYNTWMWFLKYK